MSRTRSRRGQDGYALLVILLALCVLIIGLTKAVPSWTTQIRRERENRAIDHAEQYRVAIRRYYHTYGHYPPSLDALVQEDSRGQRYLRREFLDPLSLAAGGQFQVLHYGQSAADEIVGRIPPALQRQLQGFAPLAQSGLTAPVPAAGLTSPAQNPEAPGSPAGTPSVFASGTNANQPGAGPIVGVVSRDKQPAVHSFNGFDTPDHWQFVYDFATDRTLRPATPGAPGAPAAPGTPGATPTPGAPALPAPLTPPGAGPSR
ncbi:MAG: type IV pilin protein [Terriglobales bacterium]